MANKKQQRFVEIEILKGAKLLLFLLSELRCLLIDDLIKVGIKMICIDGGDVQTGVISVLHHREVIDICLQHFKYTGVPE